MERRITVRGIIYKNGKIFAQKLKNDDGEVDFWCTPGGGLDANETLRGGLDREMIEETGIKPKIGKLLYVQQYREDNGREFLELFYHISNVDDYENEIDLASTSHGHLEVSQHGFIDPKGEEILPKFLQETDIARDILVGSTKEFTYL